MSQTCPYCHTPRTGDMTRVPCHFCGQVVKAHSPRSRMGNKPVIPSEATQIRAMHATSPDTAQGAPADYQPVTLQAPPATGPKAVNAQILRQRLMAVAAQKKAQTKPPLGLRAFNMFLVLISFFAWTGMMEQVMDSYKIRTCMSRCAEAAPVAAGAAFLFFILPRKSFVRWFFGLLIMAITGVILLLKPIAAPVMSEYRTYTFDGTHSSSMMPLSFGAETHMYYWVPGLILLFVFVIGLITAVSKIFKKIFN